MKKRKKILYNQWQPSKHKIKQQIYYLVKNQDEIQKFNKEDIPLIEFLKINIIEERVINLMKTY
jgi:hypothetical protein